VALIGHELAHARNGDAARGFLVAGAIGGLGHLYQVFAPEEIGRRTWTLGIVEPLVNAVFWLVSRPVWWLMVIELHLLLRDSQRAEYLADSLPAEVAGADAVIALDERLLLESRFRGVVQHAALGRGETAGLLDRLVADLDAVPERERERRRRVARLETSTLGATHPPTALRIKLLEQRGSVVGAVILDDDRSRAIDVELASYRPSVERKLIDERTDAMYYR
jgi:Zn-dependent protease with chaperone function